jgi:hypothetical protein
MDARRVFFAADRALVTELDVAHEFVPHTIENIRMS